ncbi:MAG TPA: hypothetical protein VGM88_14490 [Kofleriaceae bacterium]
MNRRLAAAAWILVALPALYQVVLLAIAIAGRAGYPYDLEWMEGGMLHHALRIRTGQGIYGPPSIDFIPYLYTPLYPTLLALFSNAFGLTYTLGRALSIASLLGIATVGAVSLWRPRGAAIAGIALALGLFASGYPFVDGWYDLVRADTLFLFMVTGAIAGLPSWARDTGMRGHAKVAAGAALLALSFFCKQTGILYVGLGGLIVLVVNWRLVATYTLVAATLGFGGIAIFNETTDGWFWVYVSKIHRVHDFSMTRFWDSFGTIWFRAPAASVVVVIALGLLAAAWRRDRTVLREARPLLLWSAAYAMSSIVGAVGYGTEWAVFNAYMPAVLHGALAAGAAIPAIAASLRVLATGPAGTSSARWRTSLPFAVSWLAAASLAFTCWHLRWKPAQFTPTSADVAAGDRLIAHLASLDGDVWMPSHPWYLELAGKTPHAHRMGIKDVTWRQPHAPADIVVGLEDALRMHVFSAIILDNRDLPSDQLTDLSRFYKPGPKLPTSEHPRLYAGGRVVPDQIWLPR